MSAEEAVNRRTFLKMVLTSVGACYAGALGYPVYRYLSSVAEKAEHASTITEILLKDAEQLPAGSALMFRFGSRPAMLIHHKDGAWSAMDAVCTHLGCTVEYQASRDVIHCNCHGGEYDSRSGKNIAGPPPRPLTHYLAKVVDGGVTISRA